MVASKTVFRTYLSSTVFASFPRTNRAEDRSFRLDASCTLALLR
jgi:hypothetical protein